MALERIADALTASPLAELGEVVERKESIEYVETADGKQVPMRASFG